jgi:FkbM family methyltransferase
MQLLKRETSHGRFYFWDGDWLGAKVASDEVWDAFLLPWMDALHQGQVMVDVGAHTGTFTIRLAQRGVKVHAFEASPEVFELLQLNVVENNLTDLVTLHNVALYDKEESLAVSSQCAYSKLPDGKRDYSSSECSGWMWLVPGKDAYNIRARTLDSFKIENVALIKVDTEGCDLRVLQGSVKTISMCRPVICFEFNEQPALSNGYGIDELLRFMQNIGYQVSEVAGNGKDNRDFVGVPR